MPRPLLTLCALLALSGAPAQATTQNLSLRLPLNVPVPAASPVRTKSLPPNSPPLSEVFTRSAATANCLSNAFEMPGQAWHTDLTGGGISLAAGTLDARPPTFETLYGFPATGLDNRATDSEIRMIDHFAPAPLKVGGETLMLNHGALVEAHLRALLESAGFALRSPQPLRYGRGNRVVTLTRLDLSTQVYRTKGLNPGPPLSTALPSAALAQALQQQLAENSKSLKPRDLVLNMSFAMIPCQAMNVYRETRDGWASATPPRRYNLNTFLEDVARVSALSLGDVKRELTAVADTEPLGRTIRAFAAQNRERGAGFVAVASSGNFGLEYATAPGAFPEVISAGLLGWDGQPAADDDGRVWPDAADVNVRGEWFTLSGEQLGRFCQQGGTCVTADVLNRPERYAAFAYRGTSFAAPTLSLFLALQQGPANACFGVAGTGYAPVSKAAGVRPAFDFARAWKECEK